MRQYKAICPFTSSPNCKLYLSYRDQNILNQIYLDYVPVSHVAVRLDHFPALERI